MKLSTKIDRVNLKMEILEAMLPVTHQMAMPYSSEKITDALKVFCKKLDELLNIKLEA